jgi:AcrR family transcriptional regulator
VNGANRTEPAETCQRLLDAAEQLFAERGYEATSVRDITAAAGCNVASVNYHFGGKENLYVETFRRLLREVQARRMTMIRRDMDEAGEDASLEHFVESFAKAFVDPLLAEGRGRRLMAFFDMEMHARRLPRDLFMDEFIRPMMEVTMAVLSRLAPGLGVHVGRMCMMSMVGQLVHVLKAQPMISDDGAGGLVPGSLEDHVQHVVRFSVGGIRACANG